MASGAIFDVESVVDGMVGPSPVSWAPKLSTTNVPVLISRLVWVRPGTTSRRVFCSVRDAALYLRLIFRVDTITDRDVARCAEGCKSGAVAGTMHNARYATQVECNEHGPVCRVQKLEQIDEGERMSQFFRAPRSAFTAYREPKSPSATPSPSPDFPQFAVPRPVNAPRCPTPQNMMRPICEIPPPSSPWAGVDLLQSETDNNPVVIKHIDGERYILVPLPGYEAPSVKDRPRNHMHVEPVSNFSRLYARSQVMAEPSADTSMSFPEASKDGNTHRRSDPDGTTTTTNWMSDRDRTSFGVRSGDEATFILGEYKRRLQARVNLAASGRELFGRGFPENAEIMRMAETYPAYSIFSSGGGDHNHFDNYIAVCLAIISINTKYNCDQIVDSIVRATEGVAKRAEKLVASRVDYVRRAFRCFVKTNRPSRNINSVTPELIRQNKRREKKESCWAWIKASPIYNDLCVLKAKTQAGQRRRLTRGGSTVSSKVPDIKFPDPFNSGLLVSFREIVCEQLDRVEDECERLNSWHRSETEYKVVCKSAVNRLALNINTEELRKISGPLVYPKPANRGLVS